MIKGIKFVGNPEDHTGYGRAGLYMIESLLSARIPTTIRTVNFLKQKMKLPDHIAALRGASIEYDTVLTELTPENFPAYKEPGKRNIGYFFWETSRIPKKWVDACQCLDELWLPCSSNADACRRSGVKVPIRIIPQPTPLPAHNKRVWIPGADDDTYVFYSIFQWTERKNPSCLLRAYWNAFHNKENVILVIKSYMAGDSAREIDLITQTMSSIKKEMATTLGVSEDSLCKVYFISKIISDDHITRLQNSGHCFVTAARGEGWNIPAAQAILLGQPIISPSYGGVVDFLTHKEYYSVSCRGMIQVSGMSWIKWYESNQKWCDPSYISMSIHMRTVFEQRITKVPYSISKTITIDGVGNAIKVALSEHR